MTPTPPGMGPVSRSFTTLRIKALTHLTICGPLLAWENLQSKR